MSTPGENFELATSALKAKDWTRAAEQLQEGLRAKPDAAPWRYLQLGRALAGTADYLGSAEAYREAVARRADPPAQWYFELGRAEAQLREWGDAADAYEDAFECRDDPPPRAWWILRGIAYERLGRSEDARTIYHAWLSHDPRTTPAERAMLDREALEFPGRLRMVRFVAKHLDDIRADAEQTLVPLPSAPNADLSDSIYAYWSQGFKAAPDLVRKCHQHLLKHSSAPVIELDEKRLGEFVEIPADVDAIGIGHTHRSDLLRLELLARYGGTWIDATCLVVADPAVEVRRLRSQSGFFAFSKRQTTFATWLLSSTPNHWIVRMLLAALYKYWRTFGRLTHYFALHHIFEALMMLDEEFRNAWDAGPRLSYNAAFMIRWHLLDPYEPERYDKMINGSFVHKLTYKYDPADGTPDTMIGHLLDSL